MTFSTERRIEFCNTDAAGIAHFSAFYPMMESAEHELTDSGLKKVPIPESIRQRLNGHLLPGPLSEE